MPISWRSPGPTRGFHRSLPHGSGYPMVAPERTAAPSSQRRLDVGYVVTAGYGGVRLDVPSPVLVTGNTMAHLGFWMVLVINHGYTCYNLPDRATIVIIIPASKWSVLPTHGRY